MDLYTYIKDIHSLVIMRILTSNLCFENLWKEIDGSEDSCEEFALGLRLVGIRVNGLVRQGKGSLDWACGGPVVCIRWRAFVSMFLAVF